MENEERLTDLFSELEHASAQFHRLAQHAAHAGLSQPRSQHRGLLVEVRRLYDDLGALLDASAVSEGIVTALTARVRTMTAQLLSAMKTTGTSGPQILQ